MYLHIYTSISQVLKLPETFINEKKKKKICFTIGCFR